MSAKPIPIFEVSTVFISAQNTEAGIHSRRFNDGFLQRVQNKGRQTVESQVRLLEHQWHQGMGRCKYSNLLNISVTQIIVAGCNKGPLLI